MWLFCLLLLRLGLDISAYENDLHIKYFLNKDEHLSHDYFVNWGNQAEMSHLLKQDPDFYYKIMQISQYINSMSDNLKVFKINQMNQDDLADISSLCIKQMEIVLDSFNNSFSEDISFNERSTNPNIHSAAKMLDAWGKLPPGVLEGNTLWTGWSSECESITFKYYPHQPEISGHFKTEQSVFLTIVSSESSWRLPLSIGVCLPKDCTTNDVKSIVQSLSLYPIISVRKGMEAQYGFVFWLSVVIFGLLLIFGILGSLADWMILVKEKRIESGIFLLKFLRSNEKDKTNSLEDGAIDPDLIQSTNSLDFIKNSKVIQFLQTFSLYSNISKILSIPSKQSPGAIGCLSGIRVMSMSWVVMGHVLLCEQMLFTDNGLQVISNKITQIPFQVLLNATLSVDSFFLLSGCLVTYLTLGKLQKQSNSAGSPKFWGLFYFHRIWRLTPPLALSMLAMNGFFKQLIEPQVLPFWSPDLLCINCDSYWYLGLLYLTNFQREAKMCMRWLWYLANDMQFYVISPLLLIPMSIKPILGFIATIMVTLASCIASAIYSGVNTAPPEGFHVLDNTHGYNIDAGSNLYYKPWFRFATYGIGMILGFLLHLKKPGQIRIPPILNLFGWITATGLGITILFGEYPTYSGHYMSRFCAAMSNGFARATWSAAVGWVIFSCSHGSGGLVNSVLSWKLFAMVSRLTYVVYLIHCPMILMMTMSQDHPSHYDDLAYALASVGMWGIVYSLSVLFSALTESPFMNLERLILPQRTTVESN